MNRKIIKEIYNSIYKKYRINYSKKEIKMALIIMIFIYYMLEHTEEYDIYINSILEKEIIPLLFVSKKEKLIEEEIIIPIEKQLKLNNYISNIYRNLKVIKDVKFMEEICREILDYQRINVEELVEFINMEIEKDEIKEGKSINQLIKNIIPQKVNKVLDNFSGIGESIFSVIENKSVYVQLQEIDEMQCAISTIILTMYRYKNFNVINTNTLTYYDDTKFDLIVSIPPLIIDTTNSIYNNNYFSNESISKRDNWGGLIVSYDKLDEDGEFITLVNTGALTSGKKSDKNIREKLLEEQSIRAIIELPEKMLNGTIIKTSLLIINKRINEEVILINLDSKEGEKYLQKNPFETVKITEEGIKEIKDILYENKRSEISTIKYRYNLLENLELLPSLYIFQNEEYEYEDLEKIKEETNKLRQKINRLECEYENEKYQFLKYIRKEEENKMGELEELWLKNEKFRYKNMEQIVSWISNLEKEEIKEETRKLFSIVPIDQIEKYVKQCIEMNFRDKAFRYQDLVNELGKRLGYKVNFGEYKVAKKEEFDGLWQTKEGHTFIIESRISDSISDNFSIDLSKINNYRRRLIEEKKILEEKSSIILVVGKKSSDTVVKLLRGSIYSNMKAIGVDSLINIVKELNRRNNDDDFYKKILNVLNMENTFDLDPIIKVILPEKTTILNTSSNTNKVLRLNGDKRIRKQQIQFYDKCVNEIYHNKKIELYKREDGRSRVLYEDKDKQNGIVIVNSDITKKKEYDFFWFAFHKRYFKYLEEYKNRYIAFGCGSEKHILLIPINFIEENISKLKYTERNKRIHWHISIKLKDNKFLLNLPLNDNKWIDITNYLM